MKSNLSRRELLVSAMGVPLTVAWMQSSGPSATPIRVTPQRHAFAIGDRREFLLSGSCHYCRCPHELWHDRLLKLKRAGMNCVSTYVPWNFHETKEGEFNFAGDRDLAAFLGLCQELQLHAFLRVGPFICAEWENGGYPAWLNAKPRAEFRILNATVQPYVRKWFDRLVPLISPFQATNGGPLVMVQQENEYYWTGRTGTIEYQEFLITTLRELGIRVPITDCNGLSNIAPGSLKTLNGGGISDIRNLRQKFPNLPVFVSELYTGWLECWGWPSDPFPPVEVLQQQLAEMLSQQAMYSVYMFHGGTNFGFWASSSWKSDHSFITTRYFSQSAIAEGGSLTSKYFACKAAAMTGHLYRDFLCSAEPRDMPLQVSGPVRCSALKGSQGTLLFTQPSRPVKAVQEYRVDGQPPFLSTIQEWPSGDMAEEPGVLKLRSGQRVPLAVPSTEPAILPFEFQLDAKTRIDLATCTLFALGGRDEDRMLFVRGQAGRTGTISVNQDVKSFVFATDHPVKLVAGGSVIVALSQELADRTWCVDGRVLVGPAYIGEQHGSTHECWVDDNTASIHVVSPEGEQDTRHVEAARSLTSDTLPLANWKDGRSFKEIAGLGDWQPIDTPQSVEHLGADLGYTWYSATHRSSSSRRSQLFFTAAADRIHVFQDGKRLGIWGTGAGASRDFIPVNLQAGPNRFTFLCDNMGRLSEGKCGQLKGIYGPVYTDARMLTLDSGEWQNVTGAPRNSWEFETYRQSYADAAYSFSQIRLRASVPQAHGAILSLRWMPQYAWIDVNGVPAGEHAGDLALISGLGFSQFRLDSYLNDKITEISLTCFGPEPENVRTHVVLIAYPLTESLADWRFRPWAEPATQGTSATNAGAPLWWECEFEKPKLLPPLFWVTQGLSKGQAFLNGRALGRYWEIGPQHSLYLPEPWLQPRNRLAVFDELGNSPHGSYLIRDSRSPSRMLLI
ncbi:MAG: beta-galactosidase [Acidobacteriaceae bacterium]|nr:beta-galactosidase [Acidobacteriaceae bacterium]